MRKKSIKISQRQISRLRNETCNSNNALGKSHLQRTPSGKTNSRIRIGKQFSLGSYANDDLAGSAHEGARRLILKIAEQVGDNFVIMGEDTLASNKVYLAGPLFTREEQMIRRNDVKLLRENFPEMEFFSPLEVELSVDDASITNAESTHDFYYNSDMKAIEESDLAIVDLSNDDNGTLVELGLIKGLGIPYIIVNSDFRLCETDGMHRNSFVRGIEKEALLVAKNIEEVIEFLKNDNSRN